MEAEVLELLKRSKAIIDGNHFVGTSGKHLDKYINKDALYIHTEMAARIGELFALKNKDLEIDVVAAPALGGIILSQWTAYHLSKLKDKEILSIYTEKTPDNDQVFKRGYDKLVKGKKVLIVEDLVTTGGSVKKVVKSVNDAGGNVTGVCVMANRDPDLITTESIGAPLSWLSVIKAESWDEKDCPLCTQNVPINTTVGHGKKFLEGKSKI